METLINRCPSKSYMDNSIVCDKCGKFIRYRGVYGYSHICSGHMKEINRLFKNAIMFASTREEVRKACEACDYANALYNPEHKYIRNNDI